jgi:hypothetical protein
MNIYQLTCSCIICKKELSSNNIKSHIKKHLRCHKQCPKCESWHYNEGTFCSRSCANSRIHSNAHKAKLSVINKEISDIKKQHVYPPTPKLCIICNSRHIRKQQTCSLECYSLSLQERGCKGGKISAYKQTRRSKDEIRLYELCAKKYDHVTHNDPIFNGWDADILIHDTKTAILWNGPWHYKQLNIKNHSLKQVQNRDQIKQKEIESAGWTCLIFEDRYYTPTSAFQAITSS